MSQCCFLFQVIEDNEISEEKMKLKQNIEGINGSHVFIKMSSSHSVFCLLSVLSA